MAKIENPQWAIGITTAPRRDPSLETCLKSIVACGWQDNIYIFAEPKSPGLRSQYPQSTWLQNEVKRGCWGNWWYAAKWLLAHTTANVIMTVQDDALFHPDSKSFCESILWPQDDAGFISLYTPKHYSEGKSGVHKVTTSSLWGTVAIVWPRDVLAAAVEHRIALTFRGIHHKDKAIMARREADRSLINNADYAIGKIVNALRKKMWFITPSPVSHAAVHSSISHGRNEGRRNCRPCARHSQPLASQVGKIDLSAPMPRRVVDRRKGMIYSPRPGLFAPGQPKKPKREIKRLNKAQKIQAAVDRLRRKDVERRNAEKRTVRPRRGKAMKTGVAIDTRREMVFTSVAPTGMPRHARLELNMRRMGRDTRRVR